MNKDEKKVFKTINDINQEAKNIFGDTYIVYGNKIYCDPLDTNPVCTMGKHMAVIHDVLYSGHNMQMPTLVHSRNIFRLQKSFKKYMDTLCVDAHGNMTVKMTEDCPDMVVVEKKENIRVTPNILSVYTGEVVPYTKPIDVSEYNQLSEYDVEKLIKNNYLDLCKCGLKTRITKSVIPNLKAKHTVYTKLEEAEDDMGYLYICVLRDTISSLHKYKFCNIIR